MDLFFCFWISYCIIALFAGFSYNSCSHDGQHNDTIVTVEKKSNIIEVKSKNKGS